jgi:hypothetical protein
MFVIYPILGYTSAQSLHSLTRLFPRLSTLIITAVIIPFLLLSTLRTYSLSTFYNHTSVYNHLPPQGKLCIQDWYLFQSHFFIPPNVTVGFLKSEAGLVPSLFESFDTIPKGNNDENRDVESRFMEIGECEYVIGGLMDGYYPLYCEKVLDRLKTGKARWFYMGEKQWVEYCLLKRIMN